MSQATGPLYAAITPYLIVSPASEAIGFYKQVFGAREIVRVSGADGRITHAELRIGEARLMLAEASPRSLGGSPVILLLYVEDVDLTVTAATAAGAKILKPAAALSYGDRSATLADPFGHCWTVATRKHDVSLDEMLRRASDGE